MPAGAASRYALGAGGVGAAHPAPAASLTSASRYALGARRTALRAEGAARLCAGRRSRWLPSTARATRSAPMAWALRARAPAAAFSRPRAARSAPNAWALRARAPACVPPPITARVASWWWGRRRRRALRAARDARCKARFALLPRARVGRGGPDIIMRERSGNACVLPQHVQCASARSAAGIGAPSPQARPIPRAFSARAPALRAGAVRTRRRCAPAPFSPDPNNARPSRVPPRGGGLQDKRVFRLNILDRGAD